MEKTAKMIGFGVITWAVPFLSAFFFWTPSGAPLFNIITLKTIMLLLSSFTATFFLCIYFRGVKSSQFLKEGFLIGCLWLLINWALDFLFLIPMTHISTSTYFFQIGLRDLVIPMTSIGMGYLLSKY